MNHNPAFLQSRRRLALLYAGTMGVILTVSGVGFYQAIAHSQWQSLNRKLETVAGTLHDGIEPVLERPGQIEPMMEHFLPGLVCTPAAQCPLSETVDERHVAGIVQENQFYIRFIDPQGEVLAIAGDYPLDLPPPQPRPIQQTIQLTPDRSYHQISLFLKTKYQAPWGYIQVGQSLTAYHLHLATMRWQLITGLPIAMGVVAVVSWWLSGLAMGPAYRAYQRIQEFTADAAHELRTPLAVMQSTVEFSLGEPELSDTEARNTLKIIERQNHRLTHLVQDLLWLSRMDGHPPSGHKTPCCLNRVLKNLVEEFSALAIAANLILNASPNILEAEPDPVMVLGHEENLYRLFANLVTNAIQYTPRGGTITLRLYRKGAQAMVEVQDTGVGIPLAAQAHIFNRFYRVNQDRSRHSGGVGLGLAVAQTIAFNHQGKIHVTSQVGQGSLFRVYLPICSDSRQPTLRKDMKKYK